MNGLRTDDPAILQALAAAGLDSVDGAFAFGDGEDLVKGGLGHRRRTKFELTDSAGRRYELYLKRYGSEPLAWRVRRWWTYGAGKSPAQVEFDNIRSVLAAGVETMRELAFGQQAELSYIIFSTVPGEALSRSLDAFTARHTDDGAAGRLAGQLGAMAGRLHGAGLAHRDFYAAHIFLHEPADGEIELYLIDLARVFSPRWRKRRWFVKDMAQLKYSLPDEWLAKHWQTVLDAYLGQLVFNRSSDAFAAAVDRKVAVIRRRQHRRDARNGGSK